MSICVIQSKDGDGVVLENYLEKVTGYGELIPKKKKKKKSTQTESIH